MKTRIISGLILVPLLIVCVFRGIPLAIATFLIAALGIRELFSGFEKIGIKGNLYLAWGLLVLLYIFHFAIPSDSYTPWYAGLWVAIVVVSCLISIFKSDKYRLEDAAATMFGIIYVEYLSYHMLLIERTGHEKLVWMVVITAFCTDIFAYFAGYFLGKHKLAPVLSPKKTIEGSIGGILGSLIIGIIFGLIVKIKIFPVIILMSVLGSVMAQLGDLSASAIKRKLGIKDFGNLIPGHGGILDRFDSVLFTAPTILYFIAVMINVGVFQ